MKELSHKGYSAGHPWYYFLGGAVPTIKEIKAKSYRERVQRLFG